MSGESEVRIALAAHGDRGLVGRLLQDCLRELSTDEDNSEVERIAYPYLDLYWSEEGRHPFLIKADEETVGFAFVREGKPHQMAEFYLEPRMRRSGKGLAAARRLFARFRGDWEVHELATNSQAVKFWRAAIPYPYVETVNEDGTTQCFTSEVG